MLALAWYRLLLLLLDIEVGTFALEWEFRREELSLISSSASSSIELNYLFDCLNDIMISSGLNSC